MRVSRVVDVAEHGRHVSLERGFLVVSDEDVELGRIPIDDVAALILSAYGTSYTTPLVSDLAERGAIIVTCGKNHLPVAWTLPVAGHHAQVRIISAQINAGEPLKKRLWQYIIQTKIGAQATALEAMGHSGRALFDMVPLVKSGDTSNVEARAAIEYWPTMFGDGFRRNREQDGINALLNYGYTVLRASVARAIVACGLHPSVTVYHRRDPLALADDLMEPFRPVVDCRVAATCLGSPAELTRERREDLVEIVGSTDVAVLRFVQSIAAAFIDGSVPSRKASDHVATRSIRLANDNDSGAEGSDEVSDNLLSLGFERMQLSVYARRAPGEIATLRKKVVSTMPVHGDVVVMELTDLQYDALEHFECGNIVASEKTPRLAYF